MSGTRHLSALPHPRDEQILDWLVEPETVDPRSVLDRVAEEILEARQLPRRPWDAVVDAIRPAPIGRPAVRAAAYLVGAAVLIVALVSSALIAGGRRGNPQPRPLATPLAVVLGSASPSASAAPSVSPASSPASRPPLAGPPLELVVIDDNNRVTLLRTDDETRRKVATDILAPLGQPAFAPDGGAVLLLDWTQDTDQQWSVPTVGDGRRSLVLIPCTDPCRSRNEASWSHDGSRIVLFQARGPLTNGIPEECGLAIYTLSSQTFEDVTSSPCGVVEERDPRFSPDDGSLAFWRSRSAGTTPGLPITESAVFVRDLASGVERRVTEWSSHASMLDWSPDSAWIAFVPDSWDDGAQATDVWRVRPDGTGLERLTERGTPATRSLRPRYTPDGRWILFVRQGDRSSELLAVPAEGGEPVEVAPGERVFDFDVRAAAP